MLQNICIADEGLDQMQAIGVFPFTDNKIVSAFIAMKGLILLPNSEAEL